MGKSIYDNGAIEDISIRIKGLQEGQMPLWGSMNATEMLFHCNIGNQAILNAPKSNQKPTLKQRISKFIFFHIKKDIPKGARGAKRFDVKGKIDGKKFEEEKSKYLNLLNQFKNLEHKLEAQHPVFGALDHDYWGKFVWKHMDHHLKQFGL
ncbi:DUF1569 domain-containing protein [Belliella sp. DSM 107340]|uniref:DUF1569 domain-containing protein n=1 Tax=Belliella calami TaxID=2923436 RepID=A0ABS9UQ19_9BACT|nr:DUF1569 domain-containing protein [Belliella calami]MCH7398554.1 DUF1569 domain-containing protein [Belliella calami]